MTDLTVLITGGTSGIGKQTAITFAERGFNVYFTARDQSLGNRIASEIGIRTGSTRVHCITGDLSTIKSTRLLAKKVKETVSSLDILINNAGTVLTNKIVNEDGFEITFMVHYLAPYILSVDLADLLAKSQVARILNVNTSVRMQRLGKFDIDRTPYGKDFKKGWTYNNTKVANAMLTINLAQELKEQRITVNAFYPGNFSTKQTNVKLSSFTMSLLRFIIMLGKMKIEKAGEVPFALATDQKLTSVTGQFFHLGQRTRFADVVRTTSKLMQLKNKTQHWLKNTALEA